jgi:DNA repair exonuclease SbcCD ATPase subunit
VRLSHIKISNMAGFESFASPIPAVALVQGKNGDGKSSLLNCVRYTFGRGHDEDMIHGNAPEGEIVIDLDNGGAVKCRASRERNETIRSWRAPGSKKFIVSREQIDALCNAVSYDPLAFLDLSEEKQVQTLLRIMPIECSREEIAAAIRDVKVDPVEGAGNALAEIDALHKQIYKKRHDVNVTADTQAKHAAELKKALPPGNKASDWPKEVERLKLAKAEAEQRQADDIAAVRKILDEEKEAATKEYEAAVAEAARKREERIETARASANDAAGKIRSAEGPQISQLTTELATAEERSRADAQAEGTRQAAKVAEEAAAHSQQESTELSATLLRLEQLKRTVASRLPIKPNTIEDGRIVREENGSKVPFSRWNTEAKMRFALRIGVLAHGEAGFIVIDNAEHFDTEKRQALVNTATSYAEREGLQFIMAFVSDGSLSVTGA